MLFLLSHRPTVKNLDRDMLHSTVGIQSTPSTVNIPLWWTFYGEASTRNSHLNLSASSPAATDTEPKNMTPMIAKMYPTISSRRVMKTKDWGEGSGAFCRYMKDLLLCYVNTMLVAVIRDLYMYMKC